MVKYLFHYQLDVQTCQYHFIRWPKNTTKEPHMIGPYPGWQGLGISALYI